jgi:hypothetical protein
MSEVDIWLEVMDKLGFLFIDEKCGLGEFNVIEYVHIQTNHTYQLYFNRKTEVVNSLHCVVGGVDKNSFYNKHKELFREIKLNSLV